MMSWYAAMTRANQEHQVAAHLASREIERYLPVRRETRRWSDRRKQIEIPLFTGYVFVRFADDAARLDVLLVPGVVRILGCGDTIEPIPDGEMAAVMQLAQSPTVAAQPLMSGTPGERVRVCRGPLAGVDGILRRLKGETRLVVAVPLLGQETSAEVDIADVEVAKL